MDSNCRKLGETPYRECRKQAAIYNDALGSMERAAEMLGVSVNTLSNYELGVTVPPVDIIIVMADLYRAPQLKTMYCKNECLIGRCMPVAVEAGSIDNIVIRIIKQFKESRIEGLKDKLIGIAEDGKVSEEEEKELNEICQECLLFSYSIRGWANTACGKAHTARKLSWRERKGKRESTDSQCRKNSIKSFRSQTRSE